MSMQEKRILIVCTTFSPKNVIGAIRLSKFAKYLSRIKWDVTVLTISVENNEITDKTLLCNELISINIVRLPYSNIILNYKEKVKSRNLNKKNNLDYSHTSLSIFKKIKSKCFNLLNMAKQFNWYLKCRKWIKYNCVANEFDIVFSSYPGIPAHWVAKYARDKNIASKWIADFRDPMAYKELCNEKVCAKKLKQQKKIVLSADAITAVSRALTESLKIMSNNNEKPSYFIPNGYDRDDNFVSSKQTNNETNHRQLSFAYTGGLYGGKRNIEVIFKILQELINEKTVDINNLMFNYAGKEFFVLHRQAQKYGLEQILNNHGFISREKSISLQTESNINVVCTWNNGYYHGVIPGKIYESLLLDKPTIAIINGDSCESEVAEIIRMTKIGVAFEEANEPYDYKALKQYIRDFYIDLLENGIINFAPDKKLIGKYDYQNLTNELESVFLEVLCK